MARERHPPRELDTWIRDAHVLGLGARDLQPFRVVVAMSPQTHATLRLVALVMLLGAALWPRAGRDGRAPHGSRLAHADVTSSAALAQNR